MNQVNITIQNVSFYSNLVVANYFIKPLKNCLEDRCLQNLPPIFVTSFYLYDQKNMM